MSQTITVSVGSVTGKRRIATLRRYAVLSAIVWPGTSERDASMTALVTKRSDNLTTATRAFHRSCEQNRLRLSYGRGVELVVDLVNGDVVQQFSGPLIPSVRVTGERGR